MRQNRFSLSKLVCRNMATIARRRIGEAGGPQDEMMLGPVRVDIHAIRDTADLGLAVATTEAIIEKVDSIAPTHFAANLPQPLASRPLRF